MLRSTLIATLGAAVLSISPASARQSTQKAVVQGVAHLCGTHLGGPEFSRALHAFHDARDAGLLEPKAEKSGARANDIGDRRSFRVWNWTTSSWASREFELRDTTRLYDAWVEVQNLAQVTAAELQAVRHHLTISTPSASIDPSRGIIANNMDVFGDSPDVDGDGVIDLLFYDIDNNNVGGFVHPGDLTESQGGNGRDVLHLDVYQSASYLPRLIAHEFVHLIHFNYQLDVETFISEGLAEYGMVVNGYTQDAFGYLAYPTEHKRGLFSWRGIDGENVGRDYDRGRLFFSYVAERLGPYGNGEILRSERKGAPGVDSVMVQPGVRLSEVIADFHTANWVFDTSVGERFGYTRPFSTPPAPIPDFTVDTVGSSFTPEANPEDRPTLQGGAVHYVRFDRMADLSLTFDAYASPAVQAATPGIVADIRSRLQARLVARRDDGTVVVVRLDPRAANTRLTGNFEEVIVVVTGTDPAKQSQYALDGSWRPFGTSTEAEEERPLPEGFSLESLYPRPISGRGIVEWSQETASSVAVYLVDTTGRRISLHGTGFWPAGRNRLALNVSGLAAGSYLLVLENGDQRITRSLIVAR